MTLTSNYFVGAWNDSNDRKSFILEINGSATTFFSGSEQYPGTWRFMQPDTLVVRAVIPLNIPGIDDELNAEEMVFTITRSDQNSFTATQFDCEGNCSFLRANE